MTSSIVKKPFWVKGKWFNYGYRNNLPFFFPLHIAFCCNFSIKNISYSVKKQMSLLGKQKVSKPNNPYLLKHCLPLPES